VKSIVIAGAGVIGLATALELALRGHQVTVLERTRPLAEASWAAAGMLAASDPENPIGLVEFSQFSLSLYFDFLSRLERLSGLSVPIQTRHTLQMVDGSLRMSKPGESLSRAEAAARVPGLAIEDGQTALWIEEESIDPRALGAALAGAVRAVGVAVHENTSVVSARAWDGRISVETGKGEFAADDLVVATGAWAGQSCPGGLHKLPEGSVVPRKGQMLRVRQPAGAELQTVLRSGEVYIVPRRDGSLVIGATVEDAGFDRTVRKEATEWLLERAGQLWTPLAAILPEQVEEVWTGIRPGTPDHLPVLGRLEHPQVWFATGHFRNGILLAPGTARVMSDLICGEAAAVDLRRFEPTRFAGEAEAAAYAVTYAFGSTS
jgi:glycine oxidase